MVDILHDVRKLRFLDLDILYLHDSTLSQLKKDYGFRCSITFEWKDMPDEVQTRMLRDMGGNIGYRESDKGAKVYFSKKEISVAQVIGKVIIQKMRMQLFP